MSQENIELLQRFFEAFNRGDDDAWIAAWHPEAELYELVGIVDAPEVYRGHDGVREWLANARSIIGQGFRMEPRDFTPIGEAILTEIVGRGVGEGSGVPVEWTAHIVIWMRDGKVGRTRAFLQREMALKSAGRRE
jgi:ketosteroid isomerase-like protein